MLFQPIASLLAVALYASSATANPRLSARQAALDASFQAPTASDVRSPCPGLNVLANHGFISRTGKGISVDSVGAAAKAVYNFEVGPFESVAKSAIKMLSNFTRTPGLLDLDALRKHDVIEHDASLSRDDIIQGNNWIVNPALVEQLVTLTPGPALSIEDFGYIRAVRNTQSQNLGSPPLSGKLAFGALLESSLVMNVHGRPTGPGGKLLAQKDSVKTWFLNERLPSNFVARQDTAGNLDFLFTANSVKSASGKVKFSNAKPGSKNAPGSSNFSLTSPLKKIGGILEAPFAAVEKLAGIAIGAMSPRSMAQGPETTTASLPVIAPAAAGPAAAVAKPEVVSAASMAMPTAAAAPPPASSLPGPTIREMLTEDIFDFIDMDKVKRGEYEVVSDEDALDSSKWEGILAMHGFPARR